MQIEPPVLVSWSLAPASTCHLLSQQSVGRRIGVRGRCKADARVGGVEDGVEALQEGVAVDEVETLAGRCASRADDEIDVVGAATDGGVKRTLR